MRSPEQGETPSFVLSDEDRRRLEELAAHLDFTAESARIEGVSVAATSQKGYAAFLRILASQEHRGEEKWPYTCPECDHSITPHSWHARDCSRHQFNKPLPDPSPGEAARLRERLLDDDGPVLLELREAISTEMEAYAFRDEEGEEVLANDPNVEALGNDVSDSVKAKLAAVLPAAFPAPSDSQGGEKACATCGGTRNDPANRGWEIRPGGRWKPCPDCDPASTQGEAPATLLLAIGQALGQQYPYILKDVPVDSIAACAAAAAERFFAIQGEGGDEEDWPELWIQRGDPLNPETWGIWGSAENDAVPYERDGYRRYVPAALPAAVPSEPSVLEELANRFEERAAEQEAHVGKWVEARMAALVYHWCAQLLREKGGPK